MRMEENRHRQAGQCRRGQDSGPVYVQEVGVEAVSLAPDLPRQSRSLDQKAASIGEGLITEAERTAGNPKGRATEFAYAAKQRTISWQAGGDLPAARMHRFERHQQAGLSAANLAELIEDQDLHARTASASTKKYTGSTRQ